MARTQPGEAPRTGSRRYSGLDATERARQRRSALLGAALELFGTHGYTATSVKQICRQAGLTERYFYESFRDRHACLVAVYLDLAHEMRTATGAAIEQDAGLGVDETARRALTAFIGYLTTDPRRARVVLIEVVGASTELERRRHDVLRDFAELTTAVWISRTGGGTPTEAQRMTAVGLVGAVNHLLVDWLHRGQEDPPGALVDVCASLFSAARERLDANTPPRS